MAPSSPIAGATTGSSGCRRRRSSRKAIWPGRADASRALAQRPKAVTLYAGMRCDPRL